MRSFISAIAILIFLFQPVIASADLASDLQNEINQKQTQIQELEKQIAEYKNLASQQKSLGTTLNQQITKMQTQISQLETQVKLTQTKISATGLKIGGLENDIGTQSILLEKQKANLGEILRALNEYDQEDAFSLVLKNNNFSDFLNQVQQLDNLQAGAQQKTEEVKTLKARMEVQKADYENQKNELENMRGQLKGQSAALDDQKDEKQSLLTQTKNQEKKYQTIAADLQKQRDQIEKEIFQAEEKLRQAINPNYLPGTRKGLFFWPITNTITQTYGCIATAFARKSYPACNEGKGNGGFHNGIDIDADTGDPIKAPYEGTISGIGNLGKYAYGKWITVNHGNGLTTLYGHLSAQSVSVGQKVKAGQVIGYAGSTGYSTGAHLHFTVYATNTFSIEQKWYGPLPIGGSLSPLDYL